MHYIITSLTNICICYNLNTFFNIYNNFKIFLFMCLICFVYTENLDCIILVNSSKCYLVFVNNLLMYAQ